MACQCEKDYCERFLHELPDDTAGKVQSAAHVDAVLQIARAAAAGVGRPIY